MTSAGNDDTFPVATVRESGGPKRIFASKLWWVTLVCAIIAGVLAWQSIPKTGPTITIDFIQGHGLKPGDALRHRGIDVGIVTAANLSDDLSDIVVTIELDPEADVLCREGSRFWIVRPRIDFTGIQGLETAVGSKYVAVSPGPTDAAIRRHFSGLAAAPPDELSGEGLELVLRANHRSGLNPGAPVTWRGVEVGQVLSVELSPDAQHVDAAMRLNARYRNLVTAKSKFWVTSGIDVHMGLDGFDISTESLTALALGGVSFITPSGGPTNERVSTNERVAGNGRVQNGHVFRLYPDAVDEWMSNAAAIPLVDVSLPETVIVEGTVRTTFLGIPRNRSFAASGLLLRDGDSVSLLTANLPTEENGDARQIPELHVRRLSSDDEVTLPPIDVSDTADAQPSIVTVAIPDASLDGIPRKSELLRRASSAEECCVTRSVISDGQVSSVMHMIGRERIRVREAGWLVEGDGRTDLSSWNGAPVVSLQDGRVIGILMSTDRGTEIAPIR